MTVVALDASITAGWLLSDELDPRAVSALEWLRRHQAVVPQLWHYEVRNALLVAERRGRLSTSGVTDRLSSLGLLPISTDHEADLQAAFNMAQAHELSFYDALYLELAKRRGAPLATLDAGLARAAVSEGLEILTA